MLMKLTKPENPVSQTLSSWFDKSFPPNASIFGGGIPIDVNMTHRRRKERLRVLEESF